MVELTPTKKARLYTVMQKSHKPCDVAAELGCDLSPVLLNCLQTLQGLLVPTNFYAKLHHPGCPCKINSHGLQQAEHFLKKGKCCDGADIKRTLFPQVGESTIQHNLAE
ncbi:hypothetical protein BD414DRAFT_387492, partial [Trametes punicea]